jgi:uroporphyrinogen III methyltransferase/synthase
VDLLPTVFVAEGLVELFSGLPPGKVLLARAKEARDVLILGLMNLGFDFDIVHLYETLSADWTGYEQLNFIGNDRKHSVDNNYSDAHIDIDLVTLTSASVAKGLAKHVPEEARPGVTAVSIGPITTKAASHLGFNVVAEAKNATVEGLARAAVDHLAGRPKRRRG